MTGISPQRIGAYAILGALAVVGVLWFWSTIGREGGREEPGRAQTTRAAAVPATDGLTIPSGTDVESTSGQRYWAPSAHVVVSGVVVVNVTVTAPQDGTADDGGVVVRAPTVQVLEGDRVVEPWRTDGAQRRTSPGGTVGFAFSFDGVSAEGGDVVTIRLGLDDGSQVEVTDVPVRIVYP